MDRKAVLEGLQSGLWSSSGRSSLQQGQQTLLDPKVALVPVIFDYSLRSKQRRVSGGPLDIQTPLI